MSLDPEEFQRVLFQLEMPPFNSYLETISEFLKGETNKHQKELNDLQEQISTGKISSDNNSDDMPWEYQYEQSIDYLISEVQEFENILLKSFLVTIYGFLESQLMQQCRRLKLENRSDVLAVSDIRGENTIDRAVKYLTKVQQINFSIDKYPAEREDIRNYGILRNCIVHNEGRVDVGFEERQRKELIKFINQKDSGLSILDEKIIVSQEFCKKTWKTIEKFLWLISQAKTKE